MHSDPGDNPETSTLREDASRARDWRLARFPNLMPRRVREILLVASAYDSFILEEDGLLTELIFAEYSSLGLTRAPRVTRVTNAEEALAALGDASFDLWSPRTSGSACPRRCCPRSRQGSRPPGCPDRERN